MNPILVQLHAWADEIGEPLAPLMELTLVEFVNKLADARAAKGNRDEQRTNQEQ